MWVAKELKAESSELKAGDIPVDKVDEVRAVR
jgi:hypothetical protein